MLSRGNKFWKYGHCSNGKRNTFYMCQIPLPFLTTYQITKNSNERIDAEEKILTSCIVMGMEPIKSGFGVVTGFVALFNTNRDHCLTHTDRLVSSITFLLTMVLPWPPATRLTAVTRLNFEK
jgi:hypothetical protein